MLHISELFEPFCNPEIFWSPTFPNLTNILSPVKSLFGFRLPPQLPDWGSAFFVWRAFTIFSYGKNYPTELLHTNF